MKTPFLVIILSCMVHIVSAEDGILPVWNFDQGILTDQGGFYNHFKARGSKTRIHMVRDTRRGESGRSMKIIYQKIRSGYCGVWLHVFDEKTEVKAREYLEISEHPYLSFWVKGEVGGEDFTVQMADPRWIAKEDSLPAGLASKFLKGPITTEWQEVVIPYRNFRLFSKQAGGITFNFTAKGEGTVYIDDISFKKTRNTPTPISKAMKSEVVSTKKSARIIWVWEIKAVLTKSKEREELFAFCGKHNISELFLQLPYRFENKDDPQNVRCIIEHQDELRAFLKEARGKGILCHALDGYPEFTLKKRRPQMFAMIRAIIEYNDRVEPEERYFGIHLDNEPYQLLGFDGPQRYNILNQFIELNHMIIAMLKNAKSDMVYGIDIPFWFDQERFVLTYNCKKQDASRHLIDATDNVGIMSYRGFAGEADGIIRHSESEIAYGNQAKKRIYLGVETFKYNPTIVKYIYGVPEAEWERLANENAKYQFSSTVEGFKVRTIKTGDLRLVGLAQPEVMDDPKDIEKAIIKFYEVYGATAGGRTADLAACAKEAKTGLEKDPRYQGFNEFRYTNEKGDLLAIGAETIELMLQKTTFAGKTKEELETVLQETNDAFSKDPSFIGIAIHYYKTYRDLPDK